jgi:hypothetical protein
VSTDARIASLLAFAESRMSMASADCGRDRGQFADGNNCQAGGNGSEEKQPSQTGLRLRNGIASGLTTMTVTKQQLLNDRPFKGATKMEQIIVRSPRDVAKVARDKFGINDLETTLRVGASVHEGSSAVVFARHGGAITVESMQPLDHENKELGSCRVIVTLNKMSEKSVHYDYLGLDKHAIDAVDGKKFSDRRIASEMMSRMLDSMSTAERAGFDTAETSAAGKGTGDGNIDHSTGELRGYKLWPTFGFDGEIPERWASTVPHDVMHPDAVASQKAGTLTVQQLWQTRKGEEWWKINGQAMAMSVNFKDKSSLGYKRYSKLLAMQASKSARREKRDIVEWAMFHGIERRTQLQFAFSDSEDNGCGRNGGQFAPGNHCQAGGRNPAPPEKHISAIVAEVKKGVKENAPILNFSKSKIAREQPFTTTNDIEHLQLIQPKLLAEIGKRAGVKSVEQILRVGAALSSGSSITVNPKKNGGYDSIEIVSTQHLDSQNKDLGDCTVHVSLRHNDGADKPYVHYGILGVSDKAADSIRAGRLTETRMGAAVMDRMVDSLLTAEKIGCHLADTYAAGRGPGEAGTYTHSPHYAGQMRGYKLWPTFGFDGDVPDRSIAAIPKEALSEEAKQSIDSGKGLKIQQLIATRDGESWWKKHGTPGDLVLDFKKKDSLGYKRFKRLAEFLDRRKSREDKRDFMEWALYESRGGNFEEYESRASCIRDSKGRFASGNDCQEGGDAPIPAALKSTKDYNAGSEKLSKKPPFPAAAKLENLMVSNPAATTKFVKESGIKSYDNLLKIVCGDEKGAEVELYGEEDQISALAVRPMHPEDGPIDRSGGYAFANVGLYNDGYKKVVEYQNFNVTGTANADLYQDTPESIAARNRAGAEAIKGMVTSMTAAMAAGFDEAQLMAAGSGRGPDNANRPGFKGYRLWPQIGFDGHVPDRTCDVIHSEIGDDLSREAKESYAADGSFSVQQLWASKAGERWWKDYGGPVDLSFDFKDKSSLGYKRYERFKKFFDRSSDSRSYSEWVISGVGVDPSEWPGFPPSSIETREASLLAFVESRDGDCIREDGGRFGEGNQCQAGGTGTAAPERTRIGMPFVKPKGGSLVTTAQDLVRPMVDKLGFKDKEIDLEKIAIIDQPGADVRVYPARNTDSLMPAKINFVSEIPLGDGIPGKCTVDVSVVKYGGNKNPNVYYEYFGVDKKAAAAVKRGSFPLYRITAKLMDLMTSSLEHSERNGVTKAETFGSKEEDGAAPGELAGFRLWPKFGFDGEVPTHVLRNIPNSILTPRAAAKFREKPQDLTVQDVIETPAGRKWWNQNGDEVPLMLHFGKKDTLGYKRFEKMKSMAKKLRDEGRSFEIMAVMMLDAKVEQRGEDCGRDADGKFGSGNTCSLLSGLEELLGDHEAQTGKDFPDLRYDDGTQTEIARKLHQMKVSETDLAELVKKMGGEPARTRATIVHPNIHFTVVSHTGKDLYHIDLGYEEANIYPTGASVSHDADKITAAASKVFPKTYFRKGTDFQTTTHDDSSGFKSKRRSVDAREASLLAFVQSRNCGVGPGGFQKGNTCATGAAIDTAKGAVKGAAEGVLATIGLSWLPSHVAAGAAIGGGIGAVKGLYDNQMHPTRVMKRITDIGSSEEKIAEMVKKLGGSPASSAHLGKRGISLHIKDKDGNHVFTVDVDRDSATVYPRRPTGELTNSEIDSVKAIAQKGLPSHVDIVVKSHSWHYTAKLARKGFVITAKTAGAFVASFAGPTVVDTLVGDAAYALAKRFPKKV